MSPKLKSQLGRIGRLAALAALGSLSPWVLGLHGAPTLAALQGAVVVAGEVTFRAILPTVQADLKDPAPEVAALEKQIPPAVF